MWIATRAKVTGYSHERDMLPCQDFVEHQSLPDCLLCIVADGASDAGLGEVGASIAVDGIKRYFTENVYNAIRLKDESQLVSEIKKALDLYIFEKMRTLKFESQPVDYAATVAFVVIYENFDTFLYGITGDCMIATIDLDGKAHSVIDMTAQNNYGRPDFISDTPLIMKVGFGELSKFKGFILTTDGCAKGGLFSYNNEFDSTAISAIFDNLPSTQHPQMWLEKFLSVNFAPNTPDDLSICVVYFAPESITKEASYTQHANSSPHSQSSPGIRVTYATKSKHQKSFSQFLYSKLCKPPGKREKSRTQVKRKNESR